MSSFDRLHPALQHHIVNSLGWRELRPLQELSIGPILEGKHCLLLAPTAGGKTEAAVFPVLSRMMSLGWTGLSVLYICPLKALLNNLHLRLEQYTALVGRTCGLWHGDIEQARRQRILRQQPDILLTTPESLEAMLVSRRVEHREVFRSLTTIIVDEIHAFAGDDRGWHLLAVLERVIRLTSIEPQRIGLSATVGNPPQLLDWLAGHCTGEREVVSAPAADALAAEVQVDFVGSLENAATVVSRMHQGEKRLVFCDSRSRVEQLGAILRRLGVETFLSHSSLSIEERREAERNFGAGRNCVIVATSTLELGIDVGDLDRVIQIDAPATVASFLQRLGRTGRRPGTRRSCLFLATTEEALHQTVALLELWKERYVEPVRPPPQPMHLFAQQLLALSLQESGIGRAAWPLWLLRLPAFAAIPEADRASILEHLLADGILHDDQGILSIGQKGEAEFGYRYFSELLSMFTSSPMVTVFHGQRELGMIDQANFMTRTDGPRSLALGGRAWKVVEINWRARRAQVEPDPAEGRTRWFGGAVGLGFRLCRQMQHVLFLKEPPSYLSRRGCEAFRSLQSQFDWLHPDCTMIREDDDRQRSEWWTFGGAKANTVLSATLLRMNCRPAKADSLSIRCDVPAADLPAVIAGISKSKIELTPDQIEDDAALKLKFSEILPTHLRHVLVSQRMINKEEILQILQCKVVTSVGASTLPLHQEEH